MGGWISTRLAFGADLVRQRVFSRLLAIPLALYSLFGFWREEIASPERQENLRAVTYLPTWPLSWWLAIWLALGFCWVFEAAFRRQRPGMTLKFASTRFGLEWDESPNSLLKRFLFVMLENGSGIKLEECQIRLRIKSHDGLPHNDLATFAVCKPFALRLDEERAIKLVSYEFDLKDAKLSIPIFMETEGQWDETPGINVLLPGVHDILIEALSANSKIARLKFRASYKGQGWQFTHGSKNLSPSR